MWPYSVTFVGVLNACASLAALEEGRCVHQQIMQSGLEPHVLVANSLVDIMQNVGAWRMLGVCSTRCHLEMYTWNAIRRGCAMHGHGREALKYFEHLFKIFMEKVYSQMTSLLFVFCELVVL